MRIESSVTTLSLVKGPVSEAVVPVPEERPPTTAETTSAERAPERGEERINEEEVIRAIEQANQKIRFSNTYLEFSIHEKTRQIMVKVYREDQLIREIPPEKVLDMVAQMMEWAGLLVNELA